MAMEVGKRQNRHVCEVPNNQDIRRTVSTVPPARSSFHFSIRNFKTLFAGEIVNTVRRSPERSQDVE